MNRIRKKRWRAQSSDEVKERVKQYDRCRKRVQRSIQTPSRGSDPTYYSVLKASKNVRGILSDSPRMHVAVLNHVMKHTKKSPRKVQLLHHSAHTSKFATPDQKIKMGRLQSGKLPSTVRKIAVLKSKKKHIKAMQLISELRSDYTVQEISRNTGHDVKYLYRLFSPQKKRTQDDYTRKLTDIMRDEVKRVYHDEEISYCLPDVRFANYRFMSMTLKEAYQLYLRKCQTKRKVAESTFAALKPKNIRTIQETPLRGCKCEYCQNFGLLRETLLGLGFKGIPKNHAASIEVTWCQFRAPCTNSDDEDEDEDVILKRDAQKQEFPSKACVERKCKNCGVSKFEVDIMQKNRQLIKQLKNVRWRQWIKVKYKSPDGKMKSKMDIVSEEGSSSRLLSKYFKQLKKMSRHQFMKLWQLHNFNMAKENLQPGQVLFVHDFSQNLLLSYQDEVGGKHWDHEQITVHPTSVLYACMTKDCDSLVHEEVIHITTDNSHDHKSVHQFVQTTIHHLEEKGIEIKEIIEFTDHASSQYKSRFTFFNLSNMPIPITRHYFGVKHGKGPSDAAGANYKKFVRQAVLRKMVFENCLQLGEYSMENYLKQNITHGHRDELKRNDCYLGHSLKRAFHHKEIENIKDAPAKVRPLTGCRDWMHAVRNTGIAGIVEWRDYDCCCYGCITHSGQCSYENLGDVWRRHSLTTHTKKQIAKLDFSGWMPSYVKTKKHDVEESERDVEDSYGSKQYWSSSDDSLSGLLSSNESDSSPEEDARSLSPEEIIISSDEEENERSQPQEPVESDVSVDSDDMELLEETSSSSSSESDNDIVDWKKKLKKFNSYKTFTRLKGYVTRKALPPPAVSLKTQMDRDDHVDNTAKHFYPFDGPPGYIPVKTGSDGNCLPRALSHLYFGHERNHLEVRCRIIHAGVLHEDSLLSQSVLSRGQARGSKNVPRMYATISPKLLRKHRKLDRDDIRDVYQLELMGIRRDGEYMGVWQLHQSAVAFQRPLGSIFPYPASTSLRDELNRMILPLNSVFDTKQPVHVQWTPMSKDRQASDVCHFVCLLKPAS